MTILSFVECDGGCGVMTPGETLAEGWTEDDLGSHFCPDCVSQRESFEAQGATPEEMQVFAAALETVAGPQAEKLLEERRIAFKGIKAKTLKDIKKKLKAEGQDLDLISRVLKETEEELDKQFALRYEAKV